MDIITYVGAALVGLAIGSFLNVVIYRTPRELKFWKGRSVCPSCDQQLKWYHNIPVLSFIVLRGKCGFCGARISWRYPLIELLNAVGYVLFLWQFGWTQSAFVYAFLFSCLIAVFFIDMDFQIIPDGITLPGMVVGLGISFLPDGIGILQAGIGLVVGGGSLYLVAELGDRIFKKESLGGGDIKLAAMLGAFLGWQKVLFIFISSAAIGLVASLIMMAFSAKLRENRVIPFGPFIALAALLAMTYGDQIIAFYLDNFVRVH
ncbi:MAG: prepilin peptidase [candidate division Zixibacteria bacterium]|nr:prepilin peptidase [candidate division Zixibacteria bacterium]